MSKMTASVMRTSCSFHSNHARVMVVGVGVGSSPNTQQLTPARREAGDSSTAQRPAR